MFPPLASENVITIAGGMALMVPVGSETVKNIQTYVLKVPFIYARDGGDITSMNVARVGEGLATKTTTQECRRTTNDLRQNTFIEIVVPANRVGAQVSSIKREPLPPSVSWRVSLLPKLSPLNCSHNQESITVKKVSDKEDDWGKDSNSIDSSCGITVKGIRTAGCQEPAISAKHDKQHCGNHVYDNDDHAYEDTYAESGEHSRSIIEARSLLVPCPALATPARACRGPEDADRDLSCNSVVSTPTSTEGLRIASCKMQPTLPRSEGVAATLCTLLTASLTQHNSLQHTNKRWKATQQPNAVDLTARSCESNKKGEKNRREEELDMTDIETHRMGDVPQLTHVDKREAKCPSKVSAAPLPRVHTPRPLWLALRNRTLKITQEDPSIFSPSVPSVVPQSRANITSASTHMGCWHIINRRIFGTHEMSRCEAGVQPEWILFGGGIPPLDINDQDRWTLRLGHARGSPPRG